MLLYSFQVGSTGSYAQPDQRQVRGSEMLCGPGHAQYETGCTIVSARLCPSVDSHYDTGLAGIKSLLF